jgi:hypothetical protein
MFFHFPRAVHFIPGIQKVFVIALADQFIEFRFAQSLFIQVARFQLGAHLQQETSCFAASRSSWLLQKLKLHQSRT